MAQQRVKNQHYVPQFYLRNFQAGNDRIYVFDKSLNKSFSSAIANVASTDYFYEIDPKLLPSDAPFQIVEKALAQIEGSANELIADILRTLDQTSDYLPAQKDALCPFVALQAVRTKEFRRTYADMIENMAQRIADLHLKSKFPDEQLPDFKIAANDQVLRFQHAQQMFGEMTAEMTQIFKSHIWCFGRNLTSQPLYTSDAPVTRYAHASHPVLGRSGFGSPGIEIAFPLSSKYVLIMCERTQHAHMALPQFRVNEMDESMVMRYNSMQVSQCERQVFASEPKFDLCHQMLKDHPSLGDIDRSRVSVNPDQDTQS